MRFLQPPGHRACSLYVPHQVKGLEWYDRLVEVMDGRRRGPPPPKAVAIPRMDGSGCFWEVYDRKTGARMWRIEAFDFQAALMEKQRLCAIQGVKAGWCYLRSIR